MSFEPFEKALHRAHEWLKEISREMGDGTTDQQAYAALRGVLRALRDRLDIDEAAQLAAQVPMLIRGIYFEGWDPSGTPMKIRHREKFIALVNKHMGKIDNVDPEVAARAVFTVLKRHVSEGEIADVLAELPGEIRDMLAA